MKQFLALALAGSVVWSSLAGCASKQQSAMEAVEKAIPPAPREFRAAWVATVANIDWPSKPALSTEEQQKEIVAILDEAAELNLNAIVLQVRTSADALYASKIEPWSEYLTGKQGQAPEPFYDPLKFWVDEAHARGIQLHAWFNPYRARQTAAKGPNSPEHITTKHPEAVKDYGPYQWMDPAEPNARKQTLAVFLDVVKRYDIDGVHIDDYFYPYPVTNQAEIDARWKEYVDGGGKLPRAEWAQSNPAKEVPFPDEPAWQKYQATGGKLSRDDWRRDHINRMIEDIYEGIKREKKHVQFGISPFGIWKPGFPAPVQGFNQYEKLYADAKLWLNEGWLDYYTPQLYWKISAPKQPYRDLLEWWAAENTKGRHLWPGNYISRVGTKETDWKAQEIVDQIQVTREVEGTDGNVHFSMKALMENRGGLGDALKSGPYAKEALVPPTPWLDDRAPSRPDVKLAESAEGPKVTWKGSRDAFQWGVYTRRGEEWTFAALPAGTRSLTLSDEGGRVTAVAISAVDRLGNESRRTVRVRKEVEKVAAK